MEDNNYTLTFKVELTADVVISPDQLNNNLYDNIKSNLEQRLVGKCYNDEGFITKIYHINKVLNYGDIKLEDSDCNVYYKVKFFCQLIKPIINKTIIGKVILNEQSLLTLSNGPMNIIINSQKDNEMFSIDPETRLFKYNNKVIETGDFYKIKILVFRMTNKETDIYIIGQLLDIASEDDINKYYVETYNNINN